VDLNVRAFRLVQEATREIDPAVRAKQEASRRGGKLGGAARARSLSAAARRAIAQKANKARWNREETK
jgi:hypothetical protein